jgi:ferredoxin
MRIVVDLNKCSDHGQCVYSAPAVFSLDDNGKLSFRYDEEVPGGTLCGGALV